MRKTNTNKQLTDTNPQFQMKSLFINANTQTTVNIVVKDRNKKKEKNN
jgi:hypothetical protein